MTFDSSKVITVGVLGILWIIILEVILLYFKLIPSESLLFTVFVGGLIIITMLIVSVVTYK